MLSVVNKTIAKLFGTKSERDIKAILPIVEQIKTEFAQLENISDDELRAKTTFFKERIKDHLKEIDQKIDDLKNTAQETENIDEKDQYFQEIDQLNLERNAQIEVVLNEILPAAFAVVKETARRFTQNKELVVKTTIHDQFIASKKENVIIDGEKAIWKNSWKAAGNDITWDMVHYDVQLIGGIVLHQGKIAEMSTGEGKTLVSTLPSYLNALAERGVHLVTVNDYLAKRDSEWNAPLFEFHGMVVDCIDKHEPNTEARRKAYLADITYGTNNEFGFDYLRDNMARSKEDQVQRPHHFAMVDEVDSVLIDDARTPLIISGPVPKGDEQEYENYQPQVSSIVEVQRKLVQDFLIEAKKLISSGNKKEGGLALFRAYKGLPKSKPLIKFLSESGIKQLMNETEAIYLADNQKLMPEAIEPLYFTIDEKNNQVEMTEKGLEYLSQNSGDSQFFILPDLSIDLNKIDKNTALTDADRLGAKESLIDEYNSKAARIHTVNQLLKAYTLFEKDTEYIIVDGKVKIVDEQTGRVMEGRRYSDGLHQAIEAKEHVKVEDATQTYATITLQNYFRMYHKLGGMTGTAETEAGEFWTIYKLDVVSIPTNRPIQRKDHQDKVYKTIREKYNAVSQEIQELVAEGRPVLVGTTSVENSEIISKLLTLRKIPHNVLNAKQHAREADIVAEAGQSGKVTIATNMAGRGTDIKLSPESKAAGGLAIVGTERHESRRVDRQLRGRSGRQGDVGSSQFFVSLEDNLMRLFGSDRISKVMDRMGMEEGEVIQHSMITSSIERAQKKVEENNFGVRKRLLEYDDVMNFQRNAIYKRRQNALFGERLSLDIINTIFDVVQDIVNSYSNFEELELRVIEVLGMEPPFTAEEFGGLNHDKKVNELYLAAEKHYLDKNNLICEKVVPVAQEALRQGYKGLQVPISNGMITTAIIVDAQKTIDTKGKEVVGEMERFITLSLIDQEWKEHLRAMDDLKQSVQNAVFEQKDPLLIYKFEAVELFQKFIAKVNVDTISFLLKANIPQIQETNSTQQKPKTQAPKLSENKAESISSLVNNVGASKAKPEYHDPSQINQEKVAPRQAEKIADRNQRVNVQYKDGSKKENVKYKVVEQDIISGNAIIIP